LPATLYAVFVLFALVLFVAQSADALTRSTRLDAALVRENVEQGSGSGGTGGSNGGQSGGSGETDSQSNDVNVNEEAAQELFDEIILGRHEELMGSTTDDIINGTTTEAIPSWGGDQDTGDTEEQVETTDTENPGFNLISIFNSIISRFRGN